MIDCPPPEVPAFALQVGLETHGHAIGGLGVARLDGADWSLTLLAPAGFELFTVSRTGVETGLEAWRPWLEKLPVERDLRLAFTTVDTRCRAGEGVIRRKPGSKRGGVEREELRRWRGAGGPAVATIGDGRVTIRDPLRGYTLQLVVGPGEETDAAR